jgi:hypothetical protein
MRCTARAPAGARTRSVACNGGRECRRQRAVPRPVRGPGPAMLWPTGRRAAAPPRCTRPAVPGRAAPPGPLPLRRAARHARACHPAHRAHAPTAPRPAASLAPPPHPARRAAAAAAAAGLAASLLLGPAAPDARAEFRLPPIDSDPNRCARGFVGNTIGQVRGGGTHGGGGAARGSARQLGPPRPRDAAPAQRPSPPEPPPRGLGGPPPQRLRLAASPCLRTPCSA